MQECEWKLHEEGTKTEEQIELIRGDEYQGKEGQWEEQEDATDYEESTECVVVLFLDHLWRSIHSTAKLGRSLWYETFPSANQTLTFNVILLWTVKTPSFIRWSEEGVFYSIKYAGGDLGFCFEVSHGFHLLLIIR